LYSSASYFKHSATTAIFVVIMFFCPVQKGGFQLPVKGKHGGDKPAAEKRIADTLHTYTMYLFYPINL
jgi:hypothetical protein